MIVLIHRSSHVRKQHIAITAMETALAEINITIIKGKYRAMSKIKQQSSHVCVVQVSLCCHLNSTSAPCSIDHQLRSPVVVSTWHMWFLALLLLIGLLRKWMTELRLWKLRPKLLLLEWMGKLLMWLLLLFLLRPRTALDDMVATVALIASIIVDVALSWVGPPQ